MDKTTLRALLGSIRKWQGIVAGTVQDEGDDNCPLCQRFHPRRRKDGKKSCEGCPIAQATGKNYCDGSPYEMYEEFKTTLCAEVMVNFLKLMVPKKLKSR